jgi:hypothetical protein
MTAAWRQLAWLLGSVALASCSVEKLPPTLVVHHGQSPTNPKRVVVLPSECSQPWCRGVDAIVASDLSFHGVDVVDLTKLPARERLRTVVEISAASVANGVPAHSRSRSVTVVGPTLSDVDMWTQRAALAELGVDAIVRVRTAKVATWPVRALAIVRITRSADASLIASSACQAEVSRLDSDAEIVERVLRCALKGVSL